MQYRYFLRIWAVVLAFLLIAPTGAFAAHSKTPEEIEAPDPIKNATVNLYCRLRSNNKILSVNGSGVFISERGVILTNAHVAQYFLLAEEKSRVRGRCSVRTDSPANKTYTAEVLYFPLPWLVENVSKISERRPRGTGENDFALLYVTGATKGKLPRQFPSVSLDYKGNVTEGMAITVLGFPTEKLDFDAIRRNLPLTAAVSSISGLGSFTGKDLDVLTISHSEAARGGVSGGPVVYGKDELLGIVTVKSNGQKPTLRAITLQYINRALQAQIGLSLPSLLAGDLEAQARANKSLLPNKLVQKLVNGFRQKK